MAKGQEGKWVVPNPQIPRSFGLVNIILGAFLLLGALGFGAWYLYTPIFMKQLQTQVKAEQDREKADQDTKIAELRKQEAEAKTAEEKKSLAEERKDLELEKNVTGPIVDLPNMNVMADKRIAVYTAIEVSAAVILNVLMIVSGAALMGLTEWGRRLATLVAELKIVRWIAMTIAQLVLVLPATLEMTQKAMAQAEAQIKTQPGGAGMPALNPLLQVGMIFTAAWMVFAAVLACIYPALAWWYLTRPAARAACMKLPAKPETGPNWQTTA
jgi:hypothetical protein